MSLPTIPPNHTKVLVIGGGPAGSYAATALAREGIDVTVFEAAKFPRYHIGESMIPSIRTYSRFIGAEDKIANHGFAVKPGAATKFNQFKKEGYTDFMTLGQSNHAWNVIRSEFDELLLNHARSSGARVFELTKVKSITYSEDTSKPISATWSHTPLGEDGVAGAPITGTTTFDYVVDATGRVGLISTAHLKNRRFNAALKNIAMWGYWKGVGRYGIGTDRENAPWFEALTDETGWAWFIPLHDGTTSVGIVMNQEALNAKVKAADSETKSSMVSRYRSYLHLAPHLLKLIGDGTLVSKSPEANEPLIRSASDFSYSADKYAGDGYRIAGDAGAFIDPFFSSGVHLAFTSGLSAAATIAASIRGDCSESQAAEWHTARFTTSYTRFQLVVLSAYKQMRAQGAPVLSDIEEDNFDRAFGFLRSIIQGASEVGTRLSEDEVQRSLEFCVVAVHGPVLPENVGDDSGKPHGALDAEVASQASDVRQVIYQEFKLNNLESEAVNGYSMRLVQGSLGLKQV